MRRTLLGLALASLTSFAMAAGGNCPQVKEALQQGKGINTALKAGKDAGCSVEAIEDTAKSFGLTPSQLLAVNSFVQQNGQTPSGNIGSGSYASNSFGSGSNNGFGSIGGGSGGGGTAVSP